MTKPDNWSKESIELQKAATQVAIENKMTISPELYLEALERIEELTNKVEKLEKKTSHTE